MRLVGNDGLAWRVLEQNVAALQIMGLSGCQMKSCQITQRILRGVYVGRQAATAASNGLLGLRSFFYTDTMPSVLRIPWVDNAQASGVKRASVSRCNNQTVANSLSGNVAVCIKGQDSTGEQRQDALLKTGVKHVSSFARR